MGEKKNYKKRKLNNKDGKAKRGKNTTQRERRKIGKRNPAKKEKAKTKQNTKRRRRRMGKTEGKRRRESRQRRSRLKKSCRETQHAQRTPWRRIVLRTLR